MATAVYLPPSPPDSVYDDADYPPYSSSPPKGGPPSRRPMDPSTEQFSTITLDDVASIRPQTPPSPPYSYADHLADLRQQQQQDRSEREKPGLHPPLGAGIPRAPSPVSSKLPPPKRAQLPAATNSANHKGNGFGATLPRARSPRLEAASSNTNSLLSSNRYATIHVPTTSPTAQRHPMPPGVRPPSLGSRSQRFARFLTHTPFFHTQTFWLAAYFAFNLSLTLYNKGVLVRFPFPWTLTALHALCGSIGGYLLLEGGWYTPARLSLRENCVLLAFSVLYTVNIAVSNLSLQMVTVPFHQVVRATSPIFIILLSSTMLRKRYSRRKLTAQIPLMVGVALATYGDYYFTPAGLALTLFGTLLAAAKTVLTNVLQSSSPLPAPATSPGHTQSSFNLTDSSSSRRSRSPSPSRNSMKRSGAMGFRYGHASVPSTSGMGTTLAKPPPFRLHLHPLDILARMAPLAFIQCVFYAHLSGELDRVRAYAVTSMTPARSLALLVNGFLAFGLNVVSFTANKKVGALSITVAANVKQVLTILLAVAIFDLNITSTNGMGIAVTLAAGAWYAWIEYNEKRGGRR